jgi:lipopolysaccharide/colanic/teichoic acid biosynthesis glycosyltransferase
MIALRQPAHDALATHIDDVGATISVESDAHCARAACNDVKIATSLPRQFISRWLERRPSLLHGGTRRALLVGPAAGVGRLRARIRADAGSPLRIVGSCGRSGADALRLARTFDADLVLLGGGAAEEPALVEMLAAAPVEIVSCDMPGRGDGRGKPVSFGAVTGQRLRRRPLRPAQRRAKALFDRAAAFLLLLFLSPLLALITLAIRLDSPGPALYRQRRHGVGLAEFEILKFRTMQVGQGKAAEAATVQAQPNDPRVTRVGRMLRRTSLDELPQLLNVLKGEMSLVGPRPHPVDFLTRYGPEIPYYLERHRVAPGMTGRAQVQGLRGPIATLDDIRRRTREDLAYANRWSFIGDLAILLRSLPLLVGDEHAL